VPVPPGAAVYAVRAGAGEDPSEPVRRRSA